MMIYVARDENRTGNPATAQQPPVDQHVRESRRLHFARMRFEMLGVSV